MDTVHFCLDFFEGRTDPAFQLIQEGGAEGIAQVSVIKVGHLTPEAVIGKAAFRDQAVDMGIPLQGTAKGMQDTDEPGDEISGFVNLVKHTEHNGTDSVEQTIQTGAVFQEIRSEFFRDRKNTMAVITVDQFSCHGGCPFPGVQVAARWAETGMAAKRDKMEMAAMRAAIHGAAKGGVTAVDHLINVFNLRWAGMKSIDDLLVMITEDFLEDVHETIMRKIGAKENP